MAGGGMLLAGMPRSGRPESGGGGRSHKQNRASPAHLSVASFAWMANGIEEVKSQGNNSHTKTEKQRKI